MRRTAAVLALLALTLAGCGGRTPAEEAFLADLQERSSMIELPDPDGDLRDGHEVCEVLAATKPDERYTTSGILGDRMFGFTIVFAAQEHPCPEVDVPSPF